MPSGYAPIEPGPTPSPAINTGIGAGVILGSNAITVSQHGADVAGLAAGVTLLFQQGKQFSWFNQHKYAPLVLLILGVGIAVIVFVVIGQKPADEAIAKGCWMAWQGFENYIGQKATGLGGLPPANAQGEQS